jgi:hypothetical protein
MVNPQNDGIFTDDGHLDRANEDREEEKKTQVRWEIRQETFSLQLL